MLSFPSSYRKPLVRFAAELLQALEAEVEPDDREQHLLHNPIILCERGDAIIPLLEASPLGCEYIEKLHLEGITAFRIGVLLDNEWIAQYLVAADGLTDETMQWLECRTSEAGGPER
ncbi:hypothetical protein D3C71_1844580 [compost metagenome]